ncbi:MAG: hypothetical protein AB4057_01240 [Crocosphaera sp.]
MMFDPRTISKRVYEGLSNLKERTKSDRTKLKEQKGQAVELYTYLATWGMMRLKAEETALSQEGKIQVVKLYFTCLETLAKISNLSTTTGLDTLKNLSPDEYLGLTGLGLELAQEFSFWANAVYHDINENS